MTQTQQEQLAQLTGLTDERLARTFGWQSREEQLYRDCPSAFWLAPDGDGVLPPTDGPVRPQRATHVGHPASIEGRSSGVGQALLAAGPIFAAVGILPPVLSDLTSSPTGGVLVALVFALPVIMLVGALLGLLPIGMGVALLSRFGKNDRIARERWLWAATGGGMGLAIGGLIDAQFITLPLVITSIACAMIARRTVTWIDAEPA